MTTGDGRVTGRAATDAADPDRLPGAERMVAFTDAAVAIALTLLVLPLTELVPEAAAAHERPIEVVTGNLPVLGSFLLSFAVIGRYWLVHHRLFGYAARLTALLVWINLVWILTVAVLPFLAELIASYGSDAFVLRAYVGTLLVSSGLLTTMAILMRRTGIADGDGTGPPEAFVVGSLAASVDIAVAFLLVLIVPAVNYYALFALMLDPLTTRVVGSVRRRLAR